MNYIIRAIKLNLLVIMCVTALFVIGSGQLSLAQIVPPCTLHNCAEQWSVGTDLLVRQGNCLFKVRFYEKICSNGNGQTYCDYYFDKIEAVPLNCCYGNQWPALADIVKSMAQSLMDYVPSLGCRTSPGGGTNIWFPSCWKITTPNTLAEGCFVLSCCRLYRSATPPYTPTLYPPAETPDCLDGGPTCIFICQ